MADLNKETQSTTTYGFSRSKLPRPNALADPVARRSPCVKAPREFNLNRSVEHTHCFVRVWGLCESVPKMLAKVNLPTSNSTGKPRFAAYIAVDKLVDRARGLVGSVSAAKLLDGFVC